MNFFFFFSHQFYLCASINTLYWSMYSVQENEQSLRTKTIVGWLRGLFRWVAGKSLSDS